MNLIKTFLKINPQMDVASAYNQLVDQLGKNFRTIESIVNSITSIRFGQVDLSGGTITVIDKNVKKTSLIFLCSKVDSNPGWLRVSLITESDSFKIQSSSGTDASTVCYLIIDPV